MTENISSNKHLEGAGFFTLDHFPLGKSGVIHQVGGERALRKRLLDMGLTPGTRIFVRKVAPLGDPIELSLRGYELSLRKEDAKKIIIEEVNP